MGNKRVDLMGKRFGKLLVIGFADSSSSRSSKWLCQCECGNITVVYGFHLKNGNTKSCGKCRCSRKPIVRNGVGVGFLSDGTEFKFSLVDFSFAQAHKWYRHSRGYVVDENRRAFHREILKPICRGCVVDHINGDKLDNRRENLRICSFTENTRNRAPKGYGKSGRVGVSWDKQRSKWHAYIHVDGKGIHLGFYDAFDDAVSARVEAEKKYFGEFAPVYREEVTNVETTD